MTQRHFFYVDAEGSEISPSHFKSPVSMEFGVTEPDPGGRSIDTVGWNTIHVLFISNDGSAIDGDTLWKWRMTLDGVNWTIILPQLFGTVASKGMVVEHVFSFPVDRIIAIEPYVVSWGAGATGDLIDIYVSLN